MPVRGSRFRSFLGIYLNHSFTHQSLVGLWNGDTSKQYVRFGLNLGASLANQKAFREIQCTDDNVNDRRAWRVARRNR
jgi:hypothetical protein